jgi:hypothetical protein
VKILHYPRPPEVGTIVGPDAAARYWVVTGQDGADTQLELATREDLVALTTPERRTGEPRSLTERRYVGGRWA